MPIHALPQFEADLEEDRRIYENLKAPTSIVVRFGAMKMVGEFPYSGEAKPGCGSKMVVRTHRGTELGEMLTSTCPNAGCSKSVTRKEMLEYIDNSGGKDYPFFTQGKILRVATVEDLNEQTRLEGMRPQMIRAARAIAGHMLLPIKIVDAEPILGQERLTFHFSSEERVDFRDLVAELAKEYHARIEMHQVGARDEARLTADYERCGQHCCCKQFLKVLKPVSMKQAKIQKATLDPLKISGRCGRLMCCLRYEEQTYDDLRARLPRKKSRVQTPDGWGTVQDSQILTQLVLVQMDSNGENVAVAVEDLIKGGTPPPPPPPPSFDGPPAGARPSGPRPVGGQGDRGRPPRSGPAPAAPQTRGPIPPKVETDPDSLASADAGSPTLGDEDIDDVEAPERGPLSPPPANEPRRDDRHRQPRRDGQGQRPGGGSGGGGGGGGRQQPGGPPAQSRTDRPAGQGPNPPSGGGRPGAPDQQGREGQDQRKRKRRRRRGRGPNDGRAQGGPGAPGGGGDSGGGGGRPPTPPSGPTGPG